MCLQSSLPVTGSSCFCSIQLQLQVAKRLMFTGQNGPCTGSFGQSYGTGPWGLLKLEPMLKNRIDPSRDSVPSSIQLNQLGLFLGSLSQRTKLKSLHSSMLLIIIYTFCGIYYQCSYYSYLLIVYKFPKWRLNSEPFIQAICWWPFI